MKNVTNDRKTITDAYIRVCRDTGFTMEATRAAQFTAQLVGVHPMDVWMACGTLQTMNRIADGTHPAALASHGGQQ